jgi:hypothetical protein
VIANAAMKSRHAEGRDMNGYDCSKTLDPENIPLEDMLRSSPASVPGYIIGFTFAKLTAQYPTDLVKPAGEA